MAGILEHLKWEFLKKWRRDIVGDIRLILIMQRFEG